MGKQKGAFDKLIKILTHSNDPTPANLSKFEVFIMGDTAGGIFTKNLVHFTHGHKMTMFSSTQGSSFPLTPLRTLYEQKRLSKNDFNVPFGSVADLSVAKDFSGIKKIDPAHSKITLGSGREVGYDQLVISNDLENDVNAIEGFLDALHDSNAPVYGSMDSSDLNKISAFHHLFEHGQAVVYIPKFPFSGQVETYNFLLALSNWELGEKYGIVSPLRSLTIINENDIFSTCETLNKFIVDQLSKQSKVEVLYNTSLKKIDKNGLKLDIQGRDGQKKQIDFKMLYVHPPSRQSLVLKEAGLLKGDAKRLDVNIRSLQHQEFNNIYAFGELAELPLQPSFLSTIAQSHVVRHNVLEALENRRSNAAFNGFSELFLVTGLNQAVKYTKPTYDAPAIIKGDGLSSFWNYFSFRKSHFSYLTKIFKGKKAGPPARKHQTFPKGEQLGPAPVHSAHH